MLFERAAISQKPEELARQELQTLSPGLVFRNPYVLDFLGLKDTFLEKDLEQAILDKLEHFLLELGRGFAFLERQKRMIIDGQDYKLDLPKELLKKKLHQFVAASRRQLERK